MKIRFNHSRRFLFVVLGETTLMLEDHLLPRLRAGHPVVSIVSHEWERVQEILRNSANSLNRSLLRWSSADGNLLELRKEVDVMGWYPLRDENGSNVGPRFDDVRTSQTNEQGEPDWISGRVGRVAVDYLLWWYSKQYWLDDSILWVEDITPYFDTGHGAGNTERRMLVRRIRDFCSSGEAISGNKSIVMTFPEDYLPPELEKDVEQFNLPLPKASELEKLLIRVHADWAYTHPGTVDLPQNEVFRQVVRAAAGLTWQEADTAFRRIFADMTFGAHPRRLMIEDDVKVLNEQKAQIINKTGVLEFIETADSMDNIGGMNNLKRWLSVHRGALDDETDPPKGLLMMGVPGCGKSLMARAVATDWRLPLLSLKASNIFDKYVGESEGKISRALAIAEAIAPCVLWVDEIEKMLAGSGSDGSNDSGVSARVGGSILSWMADKKAPVFVVATANNPERLDPAYVRRGRFDERFFIDLPGPNTRRDIIKAHLKKRFPDLDPASIGLDNLVGLSHGYTGAEIEACIVEAKNTGRHLNQPISGGLLAAAMSELTPDSHAMSADIEHIRKLWGGDRARKADDEPEVDLNQAGFVNQEIRDAVDDQKRRSRGAIREF